MKIIVDVRERFLIQELENDNIVIEKRQLELGDILITNDKDEVVILIERKTPSDLMSSITDGRYNEQSYRLNSYNLHNHNIIYLIEGNYKSHKNANTILSCMFSLNYFKGFSIWQTSNVKDTKNLIVKMSNKLEKDNKPSYYDENNKKETEYIDCIKTCKKDNITNENIQIIMLSQIPNVSTTMAKVILDKFQTIYKLKELLNIDN